jgi:hypothetical protein
MLVSRISLKSIPVSVTSILSFLSFGIFFFLVQINFLFLNSTNNSGSIYSSGQATEHLPVVSNLFKISVYFLPPLDRLDIRLFNRECRVSAAGLWSNEFDLVAKELSNSLLWISKNFNRNNGRNKIQTEGSKELLLSGFNNIEMILKLIGEYRIIRDPNCLALNDLVKYLSCCQVLLFRCRY